MDIEEIDIKLHHSIPTVFDNSMTYLELLYIILGKINEVVQANNGLQSQITTIDLIKESIDDLTTNRKLSATGDFTGTWNGQEMKETEQGLQTLFNQAIGSFPTLADRLNNIDVTLMNTATQAFVLSLIGSIGSALKFKGSCLFGALPASNNTINDYYYVTDKTTNYAWNGTTWTDIGNNLSIGDNSITPEKTTFINQGKNKVNYNYMIDGQFNLNGTLGTNALLSRTGYILVPFNTDVTISIVNGSYCYLVKYKVNQVVTESGITISAGDIRNGYTFNTGSNCYVMLSCLTTEKTRLMLEIGSVRTTYEAFMEKLNPAITIDNLVSAYGTYPDLKTRLDAVDTKLQNNTSDYTFAYINEQKLCCNKTGTGITAVYSNIKVSDIAKGMTCKFIFESGTTSGTVALVINPNGVNKVTDITTKAFHIVLTASGFNLGLFDGGTNNIIFTQSFATALLLDNTTINTFSFDVNTTTNTITFNINETNYSYNHSSSLIAYLGVNCTLEHFCQGDRLNFAMPQFTYWEVRGNGIRAKDTFTRENGSLSVMPTGHVYTQLNNVYNGNE